MNEFVFPFEGDPHQGTIILLPYREDTWRNQAQPAIQCYLELISLIAKHEMVYVGIDKRVDLNVINLLKNKENITIFSVEYNDAWARDNTLIFIKKDAQIKALDFGFNAWGGKVDGLYDDYEADNRLGQQLADLLHIPCISDKDFILEGGSIHTDGQGTLLTTKACLCSKGRNSHLTMEQIEEHLKEKLAVRKVIWLDHGIYNDETNEHIDNMACFLAPGHILLATTKDTTDPQYAYSMAALKKLEQEVDAMGRKFQIHTIEVPTDLYLTKEEATGIEQVATAKARPEGERLAASYVNFYQSDRFVIVPQFNHPLDAAAYQFFKDFYPDKEVYPLYSREILLGGGNIHCVTMQIPKGGNYNG